MPSDANATPTKPETVFVACDSASERSHVAAQLAEELAARRDGAVTHLDDLAGGLGAQTGAVAVVAVDGCSSACGARLLKAHGVTPAGAFTLDDLPATPVVEERAARAALVDAAERVLGRRAKSRGAGRPAPPTPAEAHSTRAHTIEDYLLAIDWLSSPLGPCGSLVLNAPTLAAHVSAALGVSRPSAGEMLARLEERDLVRRAPTKELVLTEDGRVQADRAVQRHRVLERFVVDVLGYELGASFDHARMLSPSFDDEAVHRLAHALSTPDRCPHGWPVDPVASREEAHRLVALTTIEPGREVEIVRLPERDADTASRLAAAGIRPGVTLRTAAAAPGTLSVVVEGTERVVAHADGAQALVRAPSA